MRQKILLIVILSLLFLQGCQTKKQEEAMNRITEYECEVSGLVFHLNGLWERDQEILNEADRRIELSARHLETGTEILVFYNELEEKKGGELLRFDDYIEEITQNLENSEEYDYTVSEVSDTVLYGKGYKTFFAVTEDPSAKHHFYFYYHQNKIMTMVITVYDGESIHNILSLAKQKESL